MTVQIQMRRDTSANWTSDNPTPAQGEWCLETDTNFMKIGNGTSAWNALPYEIQATAASVKALSLQKANNLSDVADAGTSRENLHISILESCAAVAAASVNVSSPTATTYDGYSASVGDRLLLTSQLNQAQNGPWIYNGASVALSRPTDYSSGASVKGRTVQVDNGTAYDNTLWTLATSKTIVIDATATTWALANSGTNAPIIGTYMPTPTGVAATDTAAFTAALVTLGATITGSTGAFIATGGTGMIWLQNGNYVFNADVPEINGTNIGILGLGSAVTKITTSSAVTAATLNFTNSSFSGNDVAAPIMGFTLSGASGGTGSGGLEVGDRVGQIIDDVLIDNYATTGAIGLNINSRFGWMERAYIRVRANSNTTNFQLTAGSIDYSDIILTGSALGNNNFFTMSGGQIVGGRLALQGNCIAAASSNSGIGFNVTDTTAIIECNLVINLETDGTSGQIGHKCVNIASGALINSWGSCSFISGGASIFWQASTISGTFRFAGAVNNSGGSGETTLPNYNPGSGHTFDILGGWSQGHPNAINASGQIFAAAGNIHTTHTGGSTNLTAASTINATFASTPPTGQVTQLITVWGQPASGSPAVFGTVPWTWVGPSLLQTANGAVDVVIVTYDGTNFFGTVVSNPTVAATFFSPVNVPTVTAGAVTVLAAANRTSNVVVSATTAITMSTTGAVDGMVALVRITDAGTGETLTWVNTENSANATVPGTSPGSATSPTTAGFQYNGGTSKWRCLGVS